MWELKEKNPAWPRAPIGLIDFYFLKPGFTFLLLTFAGSYSPGSACESQCRDKYTVCAELFGLGVARNRASTNQPSRISTPYLLDNVAEDKFQNIRSAKSGVNGKAALQDAFSQWIVTATYEQDGVELKPDNPVLTGKIVLKKKEQLKACEQNQKNCLKNCGGTNPPQS